MSKFLCKSCGEYINEDEKICPKCQAPQMPKQNQKTDFTHNQVTVTTIVENAYCRSCGANIKKEAEICPQCGVRQKPSNSKNKEPLQEDESEKSRLIALLLWVFLYPYGAHHFYAGRISTGILQLLFGWATLYIWNIIDLVHILSGTFKDENGKNLTRWDID